MKTLEQPKCRPLPSLITTSVATKSECVPSDINIGWALLSRPLPLLIYGGSAVAAGLLTLMLPETLNRKLPETLAEGEEFGKRNKEDQSKH